MSERPMRDSEVTPAMTAWAESIEGDPGKRRLGYEERRTFGAVSVIARVTWHNYIGRTGQTGVKILGTNLFVVSDAPPAAPHDADFSPVAPLAEGVDLSNFQHGANLSAIAGSGRVFAIAKASEGLTIADASFAAHVAAARRSGILTGAYHFLRSGSDGRAQVRRFLDIIHAAGGVDLPPALDIEWQSSAAGAVNAFGGLSAGAFADLAVTAIQELALGMGDGRRPLLYTAPGFWTLLPAMQRKELASVADLWLAQYTSSSPRVPTEFSGWAFWQYTDHGAVPGYPGNADANRFAGSVEQLRAWAKGGPLPHPKTPIDLSTTLGIQRAINIVLPPRPPLDEDGDFGPATKAAVMTYQKARGLSVDGSPGPMTRAALARDLTAAGAA